VPVDWPVLENPTIYVIDVTSQLVLGGVPQGSDTVTLASNYIWRPGNREDVKTFLQDAVKASQARLQCKNGVVASMPTLRPSYEHHAPLVPVSRFKEPILRQIRVTAAFSILFLHQLGELNLDSTFRRTLASIVEQFDDDLHWENHMARALSYHADRNFEPAVSSYSRAIQLIENDPNVAHLAAWQQKVIEVRELLQKAQRQEDL